MATRNPANVIEFGKYNFSAPIGSYTVTTAGDISEEINPGEEMERIIETAAIMGSVVGLSNHSSGGTIFTLYIENSSWTAATLQAALGALALPITGAATVVDAV